MRPNPSRAANLASRRRHILDACRHSAVVAPSAVSPDRPCWGYELWGSWVERDRRAFCVCRRARKVRLDARFALAVRDAVLRHTAKQDRAAGRCCEGGACGPGLTAISPVPRAPQRDLQKDRGTGEGFLGLLPSGSDPVRNLTAPRATEVYRGAGLGPIPAGRA